MVTKQTNDFSALDFTSGEIILINKPKYWSSYKAVHKVKKAIGVKKVGHAGTLDPFATGLLILCTGKKTKMLSQFQNSNKTYDGILTLGKTSPSMDAETEITNHALPNDINDKKIIEVKNQFLGEIEQIPPMYSALKVNGTKLYTLARKNKTIERKPRKIFIYDFKIKKIDLPDIHFEITCSKGTYIRVIANDFGEKLGCGGILSNLKRIKIGEYKIEDALGVDEFIELVDECTKKGETA